MPFKFAKYNKNKRTVIIFVYAKKFCFKTVSRNCELELYNILEFMPNIYLYTFLFQINRTCYSTIIQFPVKSETAPITCRNYPVSLVSNISVYQRYFSDLLADKLKIANKVNCFWYKQICTFLFGGVFVIVILLLISQIMFQQCKIFLRFLKSFHDQNVDDTAPVVTGHAFEMAMFLFFHNFMGYSNISTPISLCLENKKNKFVK